jgi:hypothetical protein
MAVPASTSQGIGVIDHSFPDHGHRFKPTVGMYRKSGDPLPVIHSPAIPRSKIIAQVPSGKRFGRTKFSVAPGIVICMIYAKKKGITGGPGKSQWLNIQNKLADFCHVCMLLDTNNNAKAVLLEQNSPGIPWGGIPLLVLDQINHLEMILFPGDAGKTDLMFVSTGFNQ